MDYQEKNDELRALIALTALGDRQAFYRLYQSTCGYLNGVAYKIVGESDASNDVLQEAFVQIWQNAKTYKPEVSQPLTWLTSILRYRALDRLAKDRRRQSRVRAAEQDEDFADEQAPSPCHFIITENNQKKLSQCIGQLTETQAESIKLAYVLGLTREEIAERMATKINTVKSWLHRAQERLKLCLAS